MEPFVLEDFIPYQLVVLANRTSAEFSQRYREKFGISVPEWRVVAHLSQAEKVSVREIYTRVEMDKSKVSRAAARLVSAGYVRKDVGRHDKRLIELSLTKKGRDMAHEIGGMARDFQADFLARLDRKSADYFSGSLAKYLSEKT